MRAAVYHGRREIRIEEIPDPEVRAGEAVLEVHSAGICGTDAAEYDSGPIQYPVVAKHPVTGHVGPMVPGHEVAGRVVAVGPGVGELSEGDLVACGGGVSCGSCPPCLAGRTNLCRTYATVGLQRHGGLAQYCAVPADTCVRADDLGLTQDTAALGQPMAIAVHSMRQGRPNPGDTALVVGAGGIGAFLTYALAAIGVRVVVADLDSERLLTATLLGASGTIQPDDSGALDPVEEVGAHVVYEVTGSSGGLQTALDAVRRGGRVVAVGLHEQPRSVDLRALTLDEIELVGTMAHVCDRDLPEALRLLAARPSGWSDVAPVALSLDTLVDDGILPLVERRSAQIKTLVDPWARATRETDHTQTAEASR